MEVKEHKISVKITKVVQERAYEPFSIQLSEKITYSNEIKNPSKLRLKLYNKLEDQLDNLINDRLENWEDD